MKCPNEMIEIGMITLIVRKLKENVGLAIW